MGNNINSLKLNNGVKYDIMNVEETTYSTFRSKYDNSNLIPGRTYVYSHISSSNTQAHFDGEIDGSYSSNVNVFSLNLEYKIAVTATSNNTIDENIKVLSVKSGRDYIFTRCSEWEVKYDLDVSRYDWVDKLNSITKVNLFDYLNNTYYLTHDEPITTEDNEICYTFRTNTSNPLTMYGFYSTRENKFYICELERDSFNNTYYSIIRGNIQLMTRVSCGVITYLKDEYGNAMPFDFKCLLQVSQNESEYHSYPLDFIPWFSYSNGYNTNNNINKDDAISIALELNGTSTNNIVNEFYDVESHKYSIPKIQFFGPCHNNVIGKKCDDICIGVSSLDNETSYGSSNNVIGDNCSAVHIHETTAHNIIGTECSGIIIYPMSERNNISKKCTNIILYKNNNSNVIGTLCRDIEMNIGCSYNTFGMGCAELELSEYSSYNNIGTHCYQLKFINGISHITVENGTQNYIFGNNDINYCMINKNTGRQIENNPDIVTQRIHIDINAFSDVDGVYYYMIPLYVQIDSVVEQIIKPMMDMGYTPIGNDSFSILSYDKMMSVDDKSMVSSAIMNTCMYANYNMLQVGWTSVHQQTPTGPSFLQIAMTRSSLYKNLCSACNEIKTGYSFDIVGKPIETYKSFYEKYPIYIEESAKGSGSTQKMILPIPNFNSELTYTTSDFIEMLGIKDIGITFRVYSCIHGLIKTNLMQTLVDVKSIMNQSISEEPGLELIYEYMSGKCTLDKSRYLYKDLTVLGYSYLILEFFCDSGQVFYELRNTGLKLNYPILGSNNITNQAILQSHNTTYFGINAHGMPLGPRTVASAAFVDGLMNDRIDKLRSENTYIPYSSLIGRSGSVVGTYHIGNYEFVDLGLKSGTLWCDRNLGATSEEDVGEYFFFGCDKSVNEIVVDEFKENLNPDGSSPIAFYKYINVRHNKAFIELGIADISGHYRETETEYIDTKHTVYDISKKRLGNPCSTPNGHDWFELNENTRKRLFKKNGVFGILFISIINGNTIFIPFNDVMAWDGRLIPYSSLNDINTYKGVGCSFATTEMKYYVGMECPAIPTASIGTIPPSFGLPEIVNTSGPSIIIDIKPESYHQSTLCTAFPIRPISMRL